MTAAVAPRLIKLSTEKDDFVPVLWKLSLSDVNNYHVTFLLKQ